MAIDAEDFEYRCPSGVPLLARFYRPRGDGIEFHEFPGQPHAFIPRDPGRSA